MRLSATRSPRLARRSLEPPGRQLSQDRIPVHSEYAGGVADVPSTPVQDADQVLTLELLARLFQRELAVVFRACR